MTSDPVERTRLLARIRDAVLSGDETPAVPRSIVSESWQRSLAARVDPERDEPPLVYRYREVEEVRSHHPLAPVLPLLRDTLLGIADEAMHMMIVTDVQGHILWREGHRDVLRRAEQVGIVEGTRWSEDCIGTNAMGTALAADSAVQIHSAEHLVRTYHRWTCAAAPLHDPESGELIGAVDVTGPLQTFHPTTFALVIAAARLTENHLAARLAVRDEELRQRNMPHLVALRGEPGALLSPQGRVLATQPAGWLPERVTLPRGGERVRLSDHEEGLLEPLAEGWLLRVQRPGTRALPSLTLPFLGAARPTARLDGRRVQLTQRHAELLTVLALHPEGRTADELAADLYGDAGKAVTVRAEMHRLRVALVASVIRTQPYRLHTRVEADFVRVRTALTAGRRREAAELYRGPLLPSSEAPAVREEREQLAAAIRNAVLHQGDATEMWALARTPDGAADAELAGQLLRVLPAADPRRAVLTARTTTLLP
ncbi:helix-turn-helix domain-containing protein [Pseudonocardia asaccharolytica]|uniref:Transcriptional regulator n=1 Tax=Pseudonocardia asaccharolytica DSM 44247 = NBRC 16224 TaxID=1123024 RepID=A0A511CYA5_9PSEU|nr:helix-turn-helix domain-containing protein [Pseudonocardia asaccharolytica]GEL17447.1 transcriptional regulator [Pseudonocardia asaccharolytica DSM 44247 = NBRC 16224]